MSTRPKKLLSPRFDFGRFFSSNKGKAVFMMSVLQGVNIVVASFLATSFVSFLSLAFAPITLPVLVAVLFYPVQEALKELPLIKQFYDCWTGDKEAKRAFGDLFKAILNPFELVHNLLTATKMWLSAFVNIGKKDDEPDSKLRSGFRFVLNCVFGVPQAIVVAWRDLVNFIESSLIFRPIKHLVESVKEKTTEKVTVASAEEFRTAKILKKMACDSVPEEKMVPVNRDITSKNYSNKTYCGVSKASLYSGLTSDSNQDDSQLVASIKSKKIQKPSTRDLVPLVCKFGVSYNNDKKFPRAAVLEAREIMGFSRAQ